MANEVVDSVGAEETYCERFVDHDWRILENLFFRLTIMSIERKMQSKLILPSR